MKIPFIEKIGVPAKADPKKVRKEQLRKKPFKLKPIISIIAVGFILLIAVSIVTVVTEKTKDSNVSDTSAEQADALVEAAAMNSSTSEQSKYINKNILFVLTKDNTSGLQLLAVFNANSQDQSISIKYIPIDAQCFVNNNFGSMDNHLDNGGIQELLWAVREYSQLNIDRYILCDENDFTDIMKKLGEFEINIENDINSSYNGVSFIIEKGNQHFASDTMLKYFIYLCESAASDGSKLTQLIAKIAQKMLAENEQQGIEDVFNNFVKYIDTDISAMDISKYSTALDNLISSDCINNIKALS